MLIHQPTIVLEYDPKKGIIRERKQCVFTAVNSYAKANKKLIDKQIDETQGFIKSLLSTTRKENK